MTCPLWFIELETLNKSFPGGNLSFSGFRCQQSIFLSSTVPSAGASSSHRTTSSWIHLHLKKVLCFWFLCFSYFIFLSLVYFSTLFLPVHFCFSSLLWLCIGDIATLKCGKGVHVMSFHPKFNVIVAFLLMTFMWFFVLNFALFFYQFLGIHFL